MSNRQIGCGAQPVVLVLALFLFGSSITGIAQNSSGPIRDVIELRKVARSGTSLGRQVEVNGVVVGRVRSRQLLFIQGEGGAFATYAQESNALIQPGRRVRVRGITGGREGVHVVANEVTVFGEEREIPDPPDRRIREIEDFADPVHWAELDGKAKTIRRERNRVIGTLRQAGRTMPFILPTFGQTNVSWLRFARISLRGVVVRAADLGVGTEGRILWVGMRSDLKVRQVYAETPFERKLHTLSVLRSIRPNELWAYRPRIRGEVLSVAEGRRDFTVRDETGRMRVQPMVDLPVRAGDLVDVIGFTEHDRGDVYLGSAQIQILAAPDASRGNANTYPVKVYTTVKSIRRFVSPE